MEMRKLKIIAANGTFIFDLADPTARELAQSAKDSADGEATRMVEVALLAKNWQVVKEGVKYAQIVEIDGLTPKSRVTIDFDVDQLIILQDKVITFNVENENGVATVFAVGDRPTLDYTAQLTIKEVESL